MAESDSSSSSSVDLRFLVDASSAALAGGVMVSDAAAACQCAVTRHVTQEHSEANQVRTEQHPRLKGMDAQRRTILTLRGVSRYTTK